MVKRARLQRIVTKHLKSDMKRWKQLARDAQQEAREDAELIRKLSG